MEKLEAGHSYELKGQGPLLFPGKNKSNFAQLDKNRHNDNENDQHHHPS